MELGELVELCVESARVRGFYHTELLYFKEEDAVYLNRIFAEAGTLCIDGDVLLAGCGERGGEHVAPVSPILVKLLKLYEEVTELIGGGGGVHFSVDPDELADVFICLVQVASMAGIRLEQAVIDKLRADERRGYLHNGG